MTETVLMTVEETAKYMSMGAQKIRRIIKAPGIDFPYIQIGRTFFIPRKALDQWIDDSIGKRFDIEEEDDE